MASVKRKDWLLNDVPVEELNSAWRTGYYKYLESDEFSNAFHHKLAEICNRLNNPVLDLGCGSAKLMEFLNVPYLGIDISMEAISQAKARLNRINKDNVCLVPISFLDTNSLNLTLKYTVIFGGLFSVNIHPNHYVDFIDCWLKKANSRNFIIYDLLRVELDNVNLKYGTPKLTYVAKAESPLQNIPEVKLARKIIHYEVK